MEKSKRKLVGGRFGNSATEGARIFQPGVRPRGLSNNRFQSRSRMGRSASGEVASKGQTKSRVDGGRNQKVYKRYSSKKNYDSTPNPFEPLPRVSQSPRSRTSTPKTGGKLAAAGTALAVGAGIGAALGGGERKKTTSAIPAKNRAKSSASSGRKTSSKREDYLNMDSSKPVAKKASGSSRPMASAASKKRGVTSSLKPKNTDTSVSKKRATSRTPDSERAVKTVKTKGGDYKVYKKGSAAAKSFRQAFADARKAGKKVFTWNGKKYSTAVK